MPENILSTFTDQEYFHAKIFRTISGFYMHRYLGAHNYLIP